MRSRPFTVVKLILVIFFSFFVILPLFTMLINLKNVDIAAIVSTDRFRQAVINSCTVSIVSTLISIFFAFIFAWVISRTGIRFKNIISVVATLPMLIPSISHGMGLIILLGTNGIITNLFNLKGSIYGFWGIVAGSVLYSFPIAFLMIADILKYEDSTPYEAADVLGISKGHQFMSITLPYLKKPMISVIFATFTLIVTDYGVPLMVGGKFVTLPVMMYEDVIGMLDFGKGSVIGMFLLVPAVIAFIFDMTNRDRNNSIHVLKPFTISKNRVTESIGYAFTSQVCILVTLPVLSFIILSFVKKYPVDMTITADNMLKTFTKGGSEYLLNSVLISVIVSVVGVAVSFITAYCTSRLPTPFSKLLHLASITSLAIPGLVLGLSYAMVFKGSFIFGTMAILILVNIIHFFASPYLMMYNTLGKINSNIEAVGMTLGVNRIRLIKDVFIPQAKGTIFEMFSYFFVNSMMTISAVSFLSTTSTKPISLLIPQFEAHMLLECSAFVSLLILTVNIVIKSVTYLIKKQTKADKEASIL